MSAWKNKTHVLTQPTQINRVISKKKKQSTTRGISRRSTIQVLSSPDRVWLRGSNESRFFFLKRLRKSCFFYSKKGVDHFILLSINYKNLDLMLGFCTSLKKVSTCDLNNTNYTYKINIRLLLQLRSKLYYAFVAITYTLMLAYYLQDISIITQKF